MPSNGGEFSGWLDHVARQRVRKYLEIISDKKKRVRSRACALTLYERRKFRSNERLAPARQLLEASGSDPTEQKCDDGLVLSTIVICILHAIATFL